VLQAESRRHDHCMKIAIVGPIATEDVAHLIGAAAYTAPRGYGGAPILATLIESLLERGHTVVGITTDVASDGIRSPVRVRGDRLEMVYCPQRPRAFWPQAGSLGRAADLFAHERRHLRTAIQQSQPDVVHAHWLYEFAWAALQSGLPCLVTAHDSPRVVLRYMPNLYRLVRFAMAHWVARRTAQLTAVSPYMASEVRRLTRSPISVIPNPLPRDLEHPARGVPDRSDRDDSARIVSILNGWEARKNGATALRAFAQVRREHPAATLSLFGADAGPGEPAHRFASAHNLSDGVIFRGRIDHAQLMGELQHFDLLLHPALEESFGAAIAEGMALGLPVVAGAHSGAVPWVVADAGVLVDVRDPAAMSAAMLQLLRDPAARRRLGDAGRRSVLDRFSGAAVAAATEAIYVKLLAQPATRMVPA
jgi:glycosyltransferase involved in cell wall biosynthesis